METQTSLNYDIITILSKYDITICLSFIVSCKSLYDYKPLYDVLFQNIKILLIMHNCEILNKISTSIMHKSINCRYNELFYLSLKHIKYTIKDLCIDENLYYEQIGDKHKISGSEFSMNINVSYHLPTDIDIYNHDLFSCFEYLENMIINNPISRNNNQMMAIFNKSKILKEIQELKYNPNENYRIIAYKFNTSEIKILKDVLVKCIDKFPIDHKYGKMQLISIKYGKMQQISTKYEDL